MDKKEILEKSRQENKNQDLYEKDVIKNASRISLIVITVICAIFTVFEICIGAKSFFIFDAILFSAIASRSIYKAVKFKKKAKIVDAVLSTITAALFMAAYLIVMIEQYC